MELSALLPEKLACFWICKSVLANNAGSKQAPDSNNALGSIADSDTAEVLGVTAIGRVTIARLKINSAFQIRARRQWMRLGLYP